MLKRYWFAFEKSDHPSSLNLGCGVTALTQEDAVTILEKEVFPALGSRTISKITENVDVSSLDENHVIPNMGNVTIRGVWFPKVN